MEHFGGLDVSVKETSIWIVDDTGRIVKEVKVASELEALLKVLGKPFFRTLSTLTPRVSALRADIAARCHPLPSPVRYSEKSGCATRITAVAQQALCNALGADRPALGVGDRRFVWAMAPLKLHFSAAPF